MQKISVVLACLACLGQANACKTSAVGHDGRWTTLIADVDPVCCDEFKKMKSLSTCIKGASITLQASRGDPKNACKGEPCHVEGDACGYPWFESGTDLYGLTEKNCKLYQSMPDFRHTCEDDAQCIQGTGFGAGHKEEL
mmetsp:Transcript_148763/g.263049  ORF Transcript_148763/g.263049 Transcript_148763/m.263049 type:complete len:139 (-) Transcript_148763:184-600(-)